MAFPSTAIGKDQVAEVSMDMRWLDEGWVSKPISSSADAIYARDAVHSDGSSQAGQSIYCDYCEMWLHGSIQWAVHEKGKKTQKECASAHVPAETNGRRRGLAWMERRRR